MKDKIIIISIIFVICLLGFLYSANKKNDIKNRRDFLEEYSKSFNTFIKKLFENEFFDNELYFYLTKNVHKMQAELGSDGILFEVYDKLNKQTYYNYQLLVNTLPETRSTDLSNEIMRNRVIGNCQGCEDMFIRHFGTLESEEKRYKKSIYNPLFLFSNGITLLLTIPISALNSINVISDELKQKIINGLLMKFFKVLITIISLLGGIVSIVVGWEEFVKIIHF